MHGEGGASARAGVPSAEELQTFGDERMKAVLSACPQFPGQDLAQLLPAGDQVSLGLLRAMLALDSGARISSQQATQHNFFDDMPAEWKHSSGGQPFDGPFDKEEPVALDFDNVDERTLSMDHLRQMINAEVEIYAARERARAAGVGGAATGK